MYMLEQEDIALDYENAIATNARSKGMTPEQFRALGAGVTDESARHQRLKVIRPLHWPDFDADLYARLFGEMVLNVETQTTGWAFWKSGSNPCLGEILAPTLILVARDEFITPPSRAQIRHENIPDSELLIFDWSSHWP